MSRNKEPAARDAQGPVGFDFEVRLIVGLADQALMRFERDLEDYFASRGLQSRVTQCMGAVWKDDTDLAIDGQCELLSWLAAQPAVCGAVVSRLKTVEGIEDVEGPQLRMEVFSAACIAGCALYRLGLLRPDGFVRALGGFVQPLHDA